ncbi:MAG TPA: hypothetical protein VJ959_10375 [Desulfotignum sp.]|nr:hypothetical protein [Desulfotignum sp.]
MSEQRLRKLIEKRVPGLFYIIFIFAMVEFGILMICVVSAANQTLVKVYDQDSTIVYEDIYSADALTEFKHIYGINNFKDEGFVVTRILVDNKFPTRTWIALSICIPLVLILFVVFVVRVYEDVFHLKKNQPESRTRHNSEFDFGETKFEKLFSTLGRLNIYSLGATIIAAAFLYWMVPDLLVYIGKISYQTISQLKWVLLCMVLLGGIYFIVKAFLSYKTKITILQQQTDIQKNRDRLAIEARFETKLLEDRHK